MKRNTLFLMFAVVMMTGACATTDMALAPGAWAESDVAGLMQTANEGEVMQGQAASSRATSAEVRAFAQMMVSDHTAANDRLRDVLSRNNMTATMNADASTLRDNAQRTVTALNTYSGTAFDRQYMQTQVDLHQWLLSSLDNSLIPSARTAELRTLLQTQRGSVATHLERARQILNGL